MSESPRFAQCMQSCKGRLKCRHRHKFNLNKVEKPIVEFKSNSLMTVIDINS
jgi:hypothetical protein